MPIKIPDTLPAFATLVSEGVRVMTETVAVRQDIRPLQIGLLNLSAALIQLTILRQIFADNGIKVAVN